MKMVAAILLALTVHLHPWGIVSARKPTVEVWVHVDRDKGNRLLRVEATSLDGYVSATERQLDGEKAAETQRFEFKNLPEGVYQVWATVVRWDGNRWKMERKKGENLEIR